ncbi:MAG: hypothetical protein U1F20_01930 [Lysobacterales bacterium]
MTSFKAAQLARTLPEIGCFSLLLTARTDYQTMREYECFEKGAANSNTSDCGAAETAGRSCCAHHHYHHPEAEPLRCQEQEAPRLRPACRGDFR